MIETCDWPTEVEINYQTRSKHKKVQTNAYLYSNTDTQYAHFRGNPLYQATKRQLNNKQTVKNHEKLKKKQLRLNFLCLDLVLEC